MHHTYKETLLFRSVISKLAQVDLQESTEDLTGIYVGVRKEGGLEAVENEFWEYGRNSAARGRKVRI